jgi:hypothetical protein
MCRRWDRSCHWHAGQVVRSWFKRRGCLEPVDNCNPLLRRHFYPCNSAPASIITSLRRCPKCSRKLRAFFYPPTEHNGFWWGAAVSVRQAEIHLGVLRSAGYCSTLSFSDYPPVGPLTISQRGWDGQRSLRPRRPHNISWHHRCWASRHHQSYFRWNCLNFPPSASMLLSGIISICCSPIRFQPR